MTYRQIQRAALRDMIKSCGRSREEIIADLGISMATLYNWINGTASAARVDRLLAAIGATPLDLVRRMVDGDHGTTVPCDDEG